MSKQPQNFQIRKRDGETPEDATARGVLSPSIAGASTVCRFSEVGQLDSTALALQLQQEAQKVKNGDLSSLEAMLICQAHSLQAMFTDMASRAYSNAGEYLHATETYMRLALKAQSQCRHTLETLAEVKCPRHTAFIKQQNNAHNQQVNNYAGGENQKPPNELNELNEQRAVTHEPGETLDLGATSKTGAGDPQLATVEALNGTEDAGRQATGKHQRLEARRTVAAGHRSASRAA